MLLAGCMLERDVSRTPMTAVEQLLLTGAAEHAMHNLIVELPKESTMRVSVTGLHADRLQLTKGEDGRAVPHGPSLDLFLVRDFVATGLGRLGFRVDPLDEEPDYLARVVVESFGTTQGLTFFGMPAVQSVLIPFALPELTLYKAQEQFGYARVHVDFFEYGTGTFEGSTPTTIGRTYFHQYTALFLFTWYKTDLTAPP